MKRSLFSFAIAILWPVMAECSQPADHQACAALVAEQGVIAPGAALEQVSGEFEFTEGPIADAQGNVYFTDQPNDRIMCYTTDGKMETFLQPAGRANGLYFDKAGHLIACADEKNQLWQIDVATKEHKVLVENFDGKLLNGPNDTWVSPTGRIYFTDPFYRRTWWTHTAMPQDKQCVYSLAADGSGLTRIADDLRQPNGIVGTPDGKTLYVADIGGRRTYVYDLTPDGGLANKTLFCSMGSDGITLDCLGDLYLTGQGVTVFDKTGKQIAHVDVQERWTANVCFGGADGNTLFITASKGLYRIKTNVHRADR